MKILLIIILYLISGPVDCSDVIGYSGGSVLVFSDINWYKHNSKYICKVNEKDCTDIIRVDTKRHQVQEGRFKLYANTNNFFLVLIRKLKPQDAGMYRFGLGDQSNLTMNLKMYNNTSSGLSKIMNAYLGQNITITCNYPGEYERNNKYVNTVNDDIKINRILETNTKFQNGRFSISDDRSAKVLSVNIRDVRETDEVFYLFGVHYGDGSVTYNTYFTQVWLHVTELSKKTPTTTDTDLTNSTALIETPSAVCFTSSVVIIIIISVCVFETLLIGGCGLMIYKVRQKRTQDNTTSFKSTKDKQLTPDYNTDSAPVYENIKMSAI
ncbi:polymeric immunoglobulin receptor-like isoform X1 [Tachysurus fulvidraco]|uniref:polymeric immunoglobulin receptor-like isoform X1 n=1 Tax=Tachysurus fulvidraco TaxID=1234273 RepID=UPI001FEEDEA6|nr:polymeric immunoglobulin receptor-like isoform X1 [Tachysurus fulvidraco]